MAGHATDARSLGRVEDWARAAMGLAHLRSLRLARFGDNMRDVAVTEGDKVEAELTVRRLGQHLWRQRPRADVDAADDSDVDELVAEYADAYAVVPELARRRRPARVAALRRAASSSGCGSFLDEGGFGAFTTNFEDLGGLRQLPGLAVQRLMADGYGFGGEGDWKTATLLARDQGDGRGAAGRHVLHGGLHLPPRARRAERSSARTCSRSARRIAAERPSLEVHPLGIGGREDPVRLVFDAATRARGRDRPGRPGRPVPPRRQRGRGRAARRAAAEAAGRARGVAAGAATAATSAEAWLTAGGPHHTVLTQAVGAETLRDFATCSTPNCS